jgi:hypothetical protein
VHSIYQYYRGLIDLRGTEDVLVYGSYDLLVPEDERIYAYTRTLADERVLIALNWSAEPTRFDPEALEAIETDAVTVLLGNYENTPADPRERRFRPYEAAVYRLRPDRRQLYVSQANPCEHGDREGHRPARERNDRALYPANDRSDRPEVPRERNAALSHPWLRVRPGEPDREGHRVELN